jgi:cytochrome P450
MRDDRTLNIDGDIWNSDPYPMLERLREGGPIAESRRGYEVLGHREAQSLLRDRRLTTDHMSTVRALGITSGPVHDFRARFLLSQQGELHQRLRKPFVVHFSPAKAEQMRHTIRGIAESQLAMIDPTGPVDLFDLLCNPVPALVYCDWVGAPAADAAFITQISDKILGVFSGDPANKAEVEAGFAEAFPYIERLVAARRANPGEDILSAFIELERSGQLTEQELADQAVALLEASTDNTAHQISLVIGAVLERPDVVQTIAERPELLAGAVEEGIRFHPHTRLVQRVASTDLDVGSTAIPMGAAVNVCVPAVQRDPSRFPDPDRFDVTREPIPALVFGGGAFSCVGAHLAKIEIQETLAALLAMYPDLELTEPVTRVGNAFVENAPRLVVRLNS